jgi:xylulokinase
LPYLSGERTPHNNAAVRGSLHGLNHDTDAASLAYAVMEGVTFGLNDGLQALKAAGSSVHRLSLVGGGARSAMWAQQLASALDVEIVTHGSSAAGGALGAARLAWLATGGSVKSVCTVPAVECVFAPNPTEQTLLAPRYARFLALYAP